MLESVLKVFGAIVLGWHVLGIVLVCAVIAIYVIAWLLDR